MKLNRNIIFVIGLSALQLMAQTPPPPSATASAKPAEPLDKEKISYAIGLNLGNQIKRSSLEVDPNTIAAAVQDVLAGRPPKMSEGEMRETFMKLQSIQRAKMEEQRKEAEEKSRMAGEKNLKDGEAFLAANAKADGVKTLPDGLQYKVLKEGNGDIPQSNDTVTVSYRGTLIDGTEFDKNANFNTPVTAVIKGWVEALQLMKVGSKWQLFVPANLAYGPRAAGPKIGPNSTLIFEMELIGIKPHAAITPSVPSAQLNTPVVSGEIIKVPSAEGLKNGEKIEVIKNGQTNPVNSNVNSK